MWLAVFVAVVVVVVEEIAVKYSTAAVFDFQASGLVKSHDNTLSPTIRNRTCRGELITNLTAVADESPDFDIKRRASTQGRVNSNDDDDNNDDKTSPPDLAYSNAEVGHPSGALLKTCLATTYKTANLKEFQFLLALAAGLASLATAAGVEARADSIADLPTCATKCFPELALEFPCLLQDPTCVCSNANLAVAIENCALGRCTIKEALTAKRISENLCGHPERDRTSLISISGVVGAAVAFAAFILRMITKVPYFGGQFHADDWAIAVAMVFGIPLGVLSVPLANAGLGKDMWNVPFDKITYILKIYYVQEVMYFATMNVTKVSILFFYLRIFPSHRFKISCYVVMGITIAYGTAVVLAALFQCTPVHLAWEHWDGEHTNYRCSNINLIGWLSAAINIVLDVVIIVMPVKQLLRLALSVKKKIHILLMFGVGFFVTIVSIIRLKSFLQFGNSHNITWDHVPVGYWSTIEGHASILCACMPAIRALLRKLFPHVFGDRTGASSNGTRNIRTNKHGSGNVQAFYSQGDGPQSPRSPRSPHAISSLGKVGATRSVESDVFPLVERGDVGPGHGFGSYTIVKSGYER
ncbi:hypothetical protein GX51_05464 [Blastomyces parvus]|uniref:CFEM domain-containing protein n=1 Tax=Blastomyces parvus TaxID=2060905 RepID=A0A2B7WX75_9EURO|nr:hypothetical protein GX51_05464 [Blastomyces parvus]